MVGHPVVALASLLVLCCTLGAAAAAGGVGRQLLSSPSRELLQTTFDGKQLITADSLPPFKAHLYGIPVPQSSDDQDILITLTTLSLGNANLYCNPLWGQYAQQVETVNFPQPGFAVWSSEFDEGVDEIFISKNDPDYRPPGARTPNTTAYKAYQPAFVCSVINVDAKNRVNYRLEADILSDSSPLSTSEQAALKTIYTACCGPSSSCTHWKSMNNGSQVFTDFCNFSGQICTPKGALQRLDMTSFGLSCNLGASNFTAFQNLTTLKLGSNPDLKGDLSTTLKAFANLSLLHVLDLSNNTQIRGSIGSGICSLVQNSLTELNLVNMDLTGMLPSCLFNNNSLLTLFYADNNTLSGPIPDEFSAASLLEVMSLTYNNLTGTIPSTISNVTGLNLMDLSSNYLTGTIPKDIGFIEPLKALILRNNSLTGSVPSSLAYASNMENIDLKQNQLQLLPPEWSNGSTVTGLLQNSSLVTARLSFNNFTGPFPTGFAQMPILTFLILNNNSFGGKLPAIPGMFPQLRAMNASNNQLTGTIPTAFAKAGIFALQPLQYQDGTLFNHVFDVSNNLLSGTIPAFLNRGNVSVYVAGGIFLGGNRFTQPCNNQTNYISDLCGTNAVPAAVNPNVSASSTPSVVAAIAPSTSTKAVTPSAPNTTVASATESASAPTSSDSGGGGGGGISGAAIAAIVVVALVLLVASIAAAVYFRRKRMDARGSGMMPRANWGTRTTGFERYNDGFSQEDELR